MTPPPANDPATAPTVQVWRFERASVAPAPPAAAPPVAASAARPSPCDAHLVTVTPATAPTIQTWRAAPAAASPQPPAPCRPPLATVEGPGARPVRLDIVNRQRLLPSIQQVAVAYQLEPALLHAVISAESAYNPQARSPKGARGLMQLMPDTARRFGVSDPYDPTDNLQGGARYLRWLLDLFNDLRLALAAYNAGEGAVQRYGNSIPPYPETRTYVQRVLEFYRYYRGQTGL
ncbi:MAG TPA: transglycosylase SLT domain-containing protein [Candidatus Competibacteraceae bacterium]|nr:transglycosylase SLT domain-containing protein [Candidatus Competibacteraceae bacterium]